MGKPHNDIKVCDWRGADDHRFALRIERYQFPQITRDYDANWLVVRISARNGEHQWDRRDACILTWELVWMRRWLATVTSVQDRVMSFLEKELTFEFLGSEPGRHHFSVDLKWALSWTRDDHPSVIRLAVSESERRRALEQLDRAIKRFPGRGEVAKINEKLGPRE